MANTQNSATMWNCPNFVGDLYLLGANQTPFLNMIGGLAGGGIARVATMEFSMAQPWALEAAAQPAIHETASVTAPNPWTYVRARDLNTCQIYQRAISVSYMKQSTTGVVTSFVGGSATTQMSDLGVNPVPNEKDFQIAAAMKQIAVDVEFTFLNGTYNASTAANNAAATGGIVPGCATCTVAGGSGYLTKAMIDELLREMAAAGAGFNNMVMFVNAFQKQRLTDLFGYAPEDRNVGGMNIKQIETDFCMLGVVWAPKMVSTKVLIADLSVCRPVFCPVPDKGDLFYEDLSKVGAAERGQIYGQIGLDFGAEEFHGSVTGLLDA